MRTPARWRLAAAAAVLPALLGTPALADAVLTPAGVVEQAKLATALRLSGPAGAVQPGAHRLGARLLVGDRPLPDAVVRFERRTADGWALLAEAVTDREGLAVAAPRLDRTTVLRAVYAGSATTRAAQSGEVRVEVSDFRRAAVDVASTQAGKPYRYGATGPDAFDCSGFVQWTFRQVGRSLPRTSGEQLRATQRLPKGSERPGDLIFTERGGRIGHVGVYAGDHRMWVAPKAGDVVKLQRIWTDAYLVGRVR